MSRVLCHIYLPNKVKQETKGDGGRRLGSRPSFYGKTNYRRKVPRNPRFSLQPPREVTTFRSRGERERFEGGGGEHTGRPTYQDVCRRPS